MAKEAASAKTRLANLNTNKRASKKPPREHGVGEIKATLAARWGEIMQQGLSRHDLLAGLTVATVAIPLNVALAIAAGLPASAGLLAGAIGGFFAAALGGSNYQVSGPAAALNLMVFGIVAKFGPGGAAAAALLCGVVSIIIGMAGFGKIADKIPHVVLAGFTTGVGLTLMNKQVPILLGANTPLLEFTEDFLSFGWLRDVNWLAVVCGLIVAFITVGLAHLKSFPSALLGIIIATFISYELDWQIVKVGEVDFSDVAPSIPILADGTTWFALLVAAMPLALLSCAESLISAKAVDSLSGGKSQFNANTELFGQGVGNLAAGFFGSMSISGVIVRSSVNQQAGARTRLAGMYHGVILVVAAYFFGHSLQVIPVAALAGLLVVIAWRLMKWGELFEEFKHDKLHAAAFVIAAAGTVTNYLMTGLIIACGVVYFGDYLKQRVAKKSTMQIRPSPHIRAVVSRGGQVADGERVSMQEQAVWNRHVRTKPKVHSSAFVHPTATVIGWVEVGREVNIAADTSVRADEGAPFYIGDRSNVQDGVVLHALKDKWVTVEGRKWAIYIGNDVSLAHQALVHGPSMIGAHSFVGFKAIVHDSIVGAGCFIGHGSMVVGVELPPRRRVPPGMVVDSPEKVRDLPMVEHAHSHFNEDVVLVNRGLAAAYARQEVVEHSDQSADEARVAAAHEHERSHHSTLSHSHFTGQDLSKGSASLFSIKPF